jgi:3-deoxy-D-arabino-heptulosonate 7-phosphate (DAHP) synthase
MPGIEMRHHSVEIIAGPCSIDEKNRGEIDTIAGISLPDGRPAIYATRVVGYKSRTELDPSGKGMGVDYHAVEHALDTNELGDDPQSVMWAREIVKDTGLQIATEIMVPHIQLGYFQRDPLFRGKLLPWNPSVDQLGPHMRQMMILK